MFTIPERRVFADKTDLLCTIIPATARVLDVGFWGQGIPIDAPHWPHKLVRERAREVDGIDITIDYDALKKHGLPTERYTKASAENFSLQTTYDVILASDLIEHLSNPGLFLESCKRHVKDDGVLVLTTPNAFNLYALAGKLSREEPSVNPDHTCYFNIKTLRTLLQKNGWEIVWYGYLYHIGIEHKESIKKKFLNLVYAVLAHFTNKFLDDLVVVARPRTQSLDSTSS